MERQRRKRRRGESESPDDYAQRTRRPFHDTDRQIHSGDQSSNGRNDTVPTKSTTRSVAAAETEEEDDFDDDDISFEIFDDPYSDTRHAITLVLREYVQCVPPREAALPIALVSQLYGIVGQRTKVDRELEQLRFRGDICFVSLPRSERGVVLRADYINQAVDVVRSSILPDDSADSLRALFERLLDGKGADADAEKLLRSAGFLRADPLCKDDPVADRLVSPHVRRFFAALRSGREELRKRLKRMKTKRVKMEKLSGITLRQTWLSTRFLIKDALGAGKVLRPYEAERGPYFLILV